MPVFTRVKTWVSNEVLTASDLNGEFNNLLNNTIPASIEDYSADVSTMQSTTDPGGVGTESLATTLAGEIQRLRYKIKQLMNGAQWYSAPVGSLSTGGISTAAIAALAVTRAKMEAVGQQLSSSASSNVTSTSYADVTNLTITITSTGRPIFLALVSDGAAGQITIDSGTTISVTASLKFVRDSTDVGFGVMAYSGGTSGANSFSVRFPASSFYHIDVVAAGTYVYKLQAKVSSGSTSINFSNVKLIAYEL